MSGIYIHIPFCKQACHYCDFHFSTGMAKKERMVKALSKELVMRKDEFKGDVVETIYFGGGTPSVLEIGELEVLLETVYKHYTVTNGPEITLEANPDDLAPAKIRSLADGPINRLSIGIQSFFEEDLRLMNRAHDAQEAHKCLELAVQSFSNLSIDLIYGIPGMSTARWQQNLQRALGYGVPHISSYALTVEPKTALAKFVEQGKVPPMDDALAQDHFNILLKVMEDHGYVAYEISNFGRPGYFSKNNTAYWQQKKYMGIGPSAHSYNGEQRGWNVRNNPKYLKAIEAGQLPMEMERLSVTDQYNEYVMTGLRTIWGVSLNRVRSHFGPEHARYLQRQANKYVAQNLLFWQGDTLLTTKKGRFLADGIAADLFKLNLK